MIQVLNAKHQLDQYYVEILWETPIKLPIWTFEDWHHLYKFYGEEWLLMSWRDRVLKLKLYVEAKQDGIL